VTASRCYEPPWFGHCNAHPTLLAQTIIGPLSKDAKGIEDTDPGKKTIQKIQENTLISR
jgi:hypothetical protein